jgi:hypothetical protein
VILEPEALSKDYHAGSSFPTLDGRSQIQQQKPPVILISNDIGWPLHL